jgi:ferredoxin--NADP+ reductase
MFKEAERKANPDYQFKGASLVDLWGTLTRPIFSTKKSWKSCRASIPTTSELTYAISREQQNAEGGKMYIQHRVAEHAANSGS